MTVDATAPAHPGTDWSELTELGDVRVGTVARAQMITVSADRLGRIRAALASAGLSDGEVAASITDICPDPLVFALTAGLPRLSGFHQSIDGGSTWRDEAAVGDGPLYAVSRISAMAQRQTSGGRHMVRVVYTTQFADVHGAVVGTADGVSMHIGAAS